MGYDRIDSMYDALSKDGAQIGTRQQFKKLMLAPGKQGYKNRLGFYNAMKQDGAQIGNSYEDFARAMGLHAVKPQQARAQKPVSQPSKPMTTAERARQIGQEYMQGKAGKSKQASAGNTSSTDYMKNWQLMHKRNDQMTPVEQMQANTMRSRMQQAQKQASQQEQRRANPISQSRITPTAQNFNETMQQLSSSQAKRARAVQQREDDARNLAQYEVEGNQFAHNDGKFGTIAPEIDSLVAPSMKEADDLSWTQYQQDLKNAGNDAYLRNKAWKDLQDNRIKNRQNVLANNLSAKLQEIYSQKGLQEHIVQSADKLNMGVEEYVDKYVTPQMMQRAQNILGVKNIEEILPQSATEYVVRRLSDSILGTLSAGQDKSREQIAREQEAMAISDGLEEMPTVKGYKANEGYKSGAGARFASTAANMAMDSPILGMTGGAANMSVDLGKQVLMGGLAKAGLVKMGAKLTAQQLAFKAANMTMAQKIASGLVEGSAKGALNLGGYSSITSALGQASTGNDTSLSALGKAALEGFEHGATTGAMFGVSGAIMAPWVSKFGINGLETSTGEKWLHGAQKLGATGVGLGVEAGTMMVADNITGDKDISVGTWLEDLVMVGAFKAGEPKNYAHIGSALYGLVHNTNNTFRVGKDQNGKWRTVDIHMTKDEQNELMNSVSGKNLVETFQKVDKSSLNSKTPLDKSITKQAYQDFMNDPNVSQSTKEKVNAAMGLFNTTSAKSYRSVNDVQNKQILEYSKNGTLLTRTSYKNADERRAILYKQKLYRDNEEMRSLAGYSKLKDLQPTDENGEVTRLAFAFLTDKGYNPNETVTEANNARLIAGLRDKNSDLYKEWEKYVDRFGSLGMLISDTRTWKNGLLEVFIGDREISLDTIMRKDPMKRTDEENKIFYQVKDALESELFPNGKPHADQSETQGQSVAEDNNLGTDQPNGEAVKQELNGLRQAETEMDVLMRDNDVFSQNFKKLQSQGLTNPQIYDWMVQNGLTQEQLEPFAHYINANARVQGMQEATKQKIEEVVSGVVQDWSYHGELNGQKMNGEQVVYVQDSEGRTLIVGSGDVAFDSTTGRAKEDVGDLLICFDPNTKEMVYLKKDDVTFMQTQNPDDFGNEYRQRLQMINSQPYNEAAQEQAMQDAGKSENQNQSESIGINQNQNSESNGSEKAPQVDTTSPEASTITAKNNTTKEGLAPQEQPQQTRKFADGTDVPMTKDSKGRPTPDYGAMKPEQAAEILSQDFGENAEKVVDGQIKKAEKALKDAEKMKVDYTAEPNDILEQEQVKAQTVEAAKKQLEQAQNIKKAMTAKAVAETVGKPTDEKVEGANEASSEVAKKFQNAPRLQGNHVSKRLPNGDKISGHYEIVPAESLTPSHDVMNDYKKSEGFPVDAEGRTINDRDYEHDKAAQQTTDQMAQKYSGQAISQVPTVSDEGIVYDGNGRTMAGQKAAKNGTDAEYIEDLMDNAQNYGFTKEQIEQSGIEHPRLVMVTDERLPYDTATFSMFNRNEKKTQSNTEQAVAKAKTLTSDEVGAIVADIEGNGSLDAFFNNSKAINDLVKTLVSKGVIGQNEVAGFMDGPDRLSAQGKEYVKNLLLGSVFKPETIRMLGVDSKIKNAAINGIRAIMDNLKLGDYSLRDEIDQAIQLLYEAGRNKMSVDDLLKQSSAFEENARDRFPMIAQAMAQALEDKPTTFRELMSEYNNIAKNYNTNEGTLGFYDKLTPEQVVEEFLNASKAIKNNNIKLYGKESETERSNDAAGNEEPSNEAGGAAGTEGNGNAETEPEIKVKKALKRIATEITKQTGIEVVTDEQKAKKALDETENIKVQRASAGSTVSGMEKMPKGLQMNPSVLTDQILNYHGDHIAKLLGEVPEDSTVKYFSAHNGVWYFYRVDHDRNIILDGAISANKDNYREYEQKIKEYYGIDGGAEAIYNYVQEAGFDTGANRNLHDYFLEGGNTRHSAMGERPNESQGEARVEDNRTSGRTLRQGSSEEQSGAIKEFRSANGEVYGFTVDGKIYLDTKKMKPETPLHEYTHLWTEALRNGNPTEWENVKSLFDEVEGLKEEVQKLYPELKGDNLYEEMITTFSGREGAKKLEKVVRGLAKEDGKTVEERAKATGFITKVKEALQKYWKGVADMLHIHFTSAEEVADKVLADWASGFNPNKAFDVNDRDGDYTKNNVEYIVKNTKLPFGKKYGEELSQEEVKSLFYGDNDYSKKYGKLFDRVYDVARKLGIKISFKIPPETYSAYGLADLDNVYLNPILLARGEHKVFPNKKYSLYVKEDTLPHAMLHELIHSVTAYALERYERDKDSMPKELRAAAESLIDLYEATRKATLDYVNEYGRENEQEFIAELSNPNFCKLLKKTNVWTRVKDAIKQFFFPLISSEKNVLDKSWKETNSYKELSSLLDDFLEHSDKGLFEEEIGVQNGEIKGKEEAKEEPVPIMPKPVDPSNPIEKAAEDYKKEHPLSEDEILNTTAFDGLPEDQKQYCIDAALDYLNGEDTSAISEAYYRNAYEKRSSRPAETAKVAKADSETVKAGQAEVSADPMEGIKNAAEGFEQEKAERERKQKEATQKVLNVIKASNEKAKTRKQLEAEKNAADNEFEAFMKELRKKQSGQLNSGFIDQNLIEAAPKMFSLAAKCAYTRIKLGMYDAKEVVKDLRNRFKDAFDGFDKRDVETFYSEIMNQKWRDGDKRMSLNEWAEHYRKLSPEYKEKLEGDSKDAEERKMSEKKFIDRVNIRLGFGQKINGIVELRKMAEECGLKDVKDTDLQELAETAIVQRARGIASSASTNDAKKFELIKKLYENQPSLNQRDSERVMKQQYSTPAPYAFLADMYVKGGGKEVKSALEPSAGNGMLTIGLPMDVVHVNDIDAQRLANLRRQGFKNVTSQDGTQPFADKDVDVVVTNPPFGSATPKEYDGYKISSLEGQMAINALESMKDDGRAAIIIGGKTEYAKNGSLNPKDKAFLGYLYSHYNVEDVINVDGSLYAKQGTTYPTRIILINGRRKFDPENKVYPPVEKNARAESVKDYDELYKRINDDILRSKDKSVDIHGEEKRKGDNAGGRTNVSDSTKENGGRVGRMGDEGVSDRTPANPKQTELDTSTRPVEQREDANGGTTESASDGNSNPDTRGGQTSVPQSERTDGSSGRGDNSISGGSNTSATDNGTDGRERGVRLQSSDVQSVSNTPTQPKEEKKQTLTTEKVAYTPSSHSMSLGAVVPARQKEALETVLNKLGDADQYLVDNLGYNDKEDLYAHLAAEQVDAVALGLKQMEKGNGFIIGDQTGIGKGRQAAAIIRYAVKQGRIPVSFTIKPNLFSDTYRDLTDIGSPELRPFILASSKDGNIKENYDEEVKGLDGRVTKVRKQRIIYNVPSTTETQRVLKYIAENGKLPEGYDYILTTYSQIRTGLQEYKGGKWKDKKKINAADRNGQLKRDAIEKLAENSIFILDESHDAAGEGSGSAFIQKVLPKAKGVTFLSATYAKTPDAMKLYALKTDLGSKSKDEKDEKDDASWKILNAIKKGGTVFQEIMSQALTRSGQMIRRERDMTGVTIDWNPLTEDETEIQAQRDKFDNIFGIFNDILNFQRTYVDAKLGEMSDDAALIQGSVDHTPGTKDMGIGNVTFASKAYNVVQQALFSIKAEKVADYAIEAIKNGEKPVIAVNNTMEGMTDEYPMGEVMDMPDLNTTLMKGLEGILRYTEKNEYGDRDNKVLRLEELGEEAVARYNEIKEKIASATSGLSISPIDVIKHRLEQAGYRVGELTGRNTEFVYNEDGKVVRQKRTDTNKNALADRFNNGDLDVLILNRSASTGISLHASTKFKDQRQRTMIFAQMQGNINEEVQMRGRIDRTGQVRRGKYVYLVSSIPAEQRLMMMFKNKLKSLDANTTSSQKSKFNEVDVQDFTNKYGDEIVLQYMAQHPEYYNKLADPLGWGFMEYAQDGLSLTELKEKTKSTITSPAYEVMKRLTLLPVKEQEVVLKDISDTYAQKIKQLDDMGMNDLEITDMPLETKTLKREVWKEGSDPGGDNAFADNTYIETVEMNVLKKPMKADEVQSAQKKMLDGKDWETWRSDKIAEIKKAQQAKIEETKAKMAEQMEKKAAKTEENTRKALEKQNEKLQKRIDKGEELKPGEHVLTEDEIDNRISAVVDDVKRKMLDKQSEAIAGVNTKYEMFIGPLYVFDPDKTVSVPTDWYLEDASPSTYPEFGRVIGFKYDKNYNLGSSSIVIATTDSRKRVEIPLTRPKALSRIETDTERFAKECNVITMNSWDRLIPKKDRTTGRIITGNMLEALADNKNIGHLVSYTTDDGKVKQGILVPDSVSTEEITGNMPIAKAYNWFTKKEGGTELKSTDGNLRLAKNFGSMYTLYVPASRKEGGKYYLNKELLDLVHGHNFQSKGKNFWATFDAEKLHDVLHILNGMEVQVKTPKDFEESRTHFREDRGIQYSKTDAKDVKNSRIIPEDVDKSVSSQIEKTYDSAIEEAYKYVSEKDKTRLHSDVERDLREFSKMRREDIVNDIKQREYDFREWERSGATPDKGGFVGYRYARFKAAEAAAKRELDYRDARAKHLSDTYGLQEGRENNLDEVARIYRELQEEKDKGRDALFSKALDIVKRLGTEFGGINDAPAENYAGVSTTQREVALFIDTLARTSTRREATAKTLLHEMIHQATVGAINLVRRGNAEGLLTPKQIDAVNTILDIYDKAVADGRIHYQEGVKSDYGGKNPYEFAAQMADTVQRKKLDFTFGQKVMNAFKELWNKGDRSWKDAFKDAWGKLLETSDKKKMDKAISDIMEDFNETIDDISMRDIESRGGTFADKLSNDSPVSSHIAQLSEKVGDKVNMVHSADEVTNKQAKEAIEEGKHITGWYDEKTGEVHLYMPNIHDRYTAEKTIWHEVVGHKGMRELFGEDRFNRFLRDVWYDLDKPENADLKKLVMEEMKYNPFNVYNAIEEGIARLAEEGRGEAGFWRNLKNKVSDFLHEIGYRMAPNTKDVKYLLWLSKNLQKNPNDPYWKMRAEAVKYRLDHEDVPDVIAKDGMFQSNDGKARDLGDLPKAEYQEATDGKIHFRTTPSAGTALDRYHRSLDEHGYMFTESYMDNMLSLKNLMTAIAPGKKIEDIASSENPYILQNTMQGAMSDAARMFERNVMKPLDKAMAGVLDAFEGKNDDEKIRNFNLYMITKHGLERNRILYVRDALKDMRMDEKKKKLADTIENDWGNEKATLDEKLERGDIDLKEYYKQMDDFIRTYVDETNKFDAGEHDYSGIHAIQKVEKSSDPYDDAEAIQSVMDSEGRMEDIKKGAVKDYWDKVKTATQYSIDCDYRNGLISRELYGHVSEMFNWYVPLRKYDEATAEDTYGYITEKGDPKSYIGKTIMRARGHKYLSETNILAQIGAMGNRAIKNGGQNAIKQAFARFIRNNSNNNLVTETSVWYVSDPITQTTVERYPDIPDDATADEISQIVSDFNMEMKDLASKGLATKVYRRGRIGYKFQRAENKSQHIVDVMIAGKKHSFIVNGNPRAAQALNGLLEHKNETGIGKIAGKISRFMAQTCTSYNPEFVMRNMIRDFEFASSNLLAKEGARYTGIFEKYYAKVGIIEGIRNSKLSDFKDTGGFGLFVKYRNGTLDTSDKIQRYFKEFMENGGETGWVQIKSMKEWTEEYKRDIKAERNKAVKVGKGFYNAIFKNLENVNEIAENMARFATYCASRDSNRSVVRSAYDAKEVSTNFNRHGSGSEIKSFKNGEMGWFEEKRKQTYRYTSAWFRNTSMFFNAGIQSTNLLVKNLKNNTAGTLGYIASGPMISGMAIALLNNFLIANEDEKDRKGVKDPYGELPDYIRRNNLCVYVGGGEFVTIPLAIEERAFYGLGDLVAGLTFSPNISGQKNPFLDAVGCMSQLVPVADYLGNASFGKHPVQETVKAVMPSATSPFIEWAYNSDWKGAPIERDNKFDENQPAWMLAYKGTPDVLLDLNKKVNAWTNGVAPGNEDMLGNSFLDAVTNPSGLQHFYSSYLGGAATFAERTLGLIKHGKDTETKDVPFVRSLFYTPSEQTSLQRTKSKWYNYKDEMEVTMANVDRLKAKNVPIDKRLSNIGEYYHFQNSKDAVKVRVIELAEKQMEQWKKLRDKSSDTESIKFANENIDRIMMDAVEQLDKLN